MSKTRSVVELGAVAGLILAAIWLAPLYPDRVTAKRIGTGLAIGAFGIAIVSAMQRREGFQELGLRFDNFLAALRWILIPMVVIVAGLLVAGYFSESLRLGPRTFRFRWSRLGWAFVQEFLLQAFVNRRLQEVAGKGNGSVAGVATIFAGLHAPNPALMVATFLAGGLWAKLFQRTPNLFVVALSHFVLAVFLRCTLPVTVLPNLRVGWSYWR